MISAKPTENLAGITIEGDHDDFYEIMESIYRMTGLEESYQVMAVLLIWKQRLNY